MRPLDFERIRTLLEEARIAGAEIDTTTLEFTIRKRIERLSDRFYAEPLDLQNLARLNEALALQRYLPFPLVVWSVQNKCYDIMRTLLPEVTRQAEAGDSEAREWLHLFKGLAEKLMLRFPEPAQVVPSQAIQ